MIGVRGLLVKLSSEARVSRVETAFRRRLSSIPVVRSLLPRIELWSADSEPRILRDAVVWRSKYGPRKHFLKVADPRLAARGAWFDPEGPDAPPVGLLCAAGFERYLEGIFPSYEVRPDELSRGLQSLKALVVGVTALDDAAVVRFLSEPTQDAPPLVFWSDPRGERADSEAEPPLGQFRDFPVLASSDSDRGAFQSLGFQRGGSLGPGIEVTLPRRTELVELCCTLPPSEAFGASALARITARLAAWFLDGLVPPTTVFVKTTSEGAHLRKLAELMLDGAILCSIGTENSSETVLALAPRIVADSLDDLAEGLEQRDDLELARASHASARFARSAFSKASAVRRFCFFGGLPSSWPPLPAVTVICVSNRPSLLPEVLRTFRRFRYASKKLILVVNADEVDGSELERLLTNAPDVSIQRTTRSMSLGESLNRARRLVDTELWAKLDDDDYYGPNYLPDLVEALVLSGAQVAGKGTYFTYLPSSRQLYLKTEQPAHAFSERFVHGGTILARTEAVKDIAFHPVVRGTDSLFLQECRLKGLSIYSSDPFNFAYVRYEAVGHHTFDVTTQEVLKGARRVKESAGADDVVC